MYYFLHVVVIMTSKVQQCKWNRLLRLANIGIRLSETNSETCSSNGHIQSHSRQKQRKTKFIRLFSEFRQLPVAFHAVLAVLQYPAQASKSAPVWTQPFMLQFIFKQLCMRCFIIAITCFKTQKVRACAKYICWLFYGELARPIEAQKI